MAGSRKGTSELEYRRRKKKLNRYHEFTFNLPRMGTPLTGAEKAAITRQWRKFSKLIERVDRENGTFIPKKKGVNMGKLPNIGETNKGIFYYRPGAKLVTNRVDGKKQPSIEIAFRHTIERYFEFPLWMRGNMEWVEEYVEELKNKFKPDYIMWAVFGHAARRYEPEKFGLYVPDLNLSDVERGEELSEEESLEGLSGVFLGYTSKEASVKKTKRKKSKRKRG